MALEHGRMEKRFPGEPVSNDARSLPHDCGDRKGIVATRSVTPPFDKTFENFPLHSDRTATTTPSAYDDASNAKLSEIGQEHHGSHIDNTTLEAVAAPVEGRGDLQEKAYHLPKAYTDQQQSNKGTSISSRTPGMAFRPPPKEWRSSWLSSYVLVLMMVFAILFVATIITLDVLSKHYNGFATVNRADRHDFVQLGDLEFGISLTWTFIPVLVLQVYMLIIAAIVKDACTRQPYIELRRPSVGLCAAPPEKSIYLDYHARSAPMAAARALRNNYFLLAYGISVTLVANIILTALTAHLFFTTTAQRTIPITVEQAFEYDVHYDPTDSDLASLFNQVLGTRVYGGLTLPWTTQNESILPLSIDHVPTSNNLTVPTQIYRATLNCRILDPMTEFELLKTATGWRFSIYDRGCEMKDQYFSTPALLGREFMETFHNSSCGLEAGISRYVVIYATIPSDDDNEPTQLTNKTAVSCIPTYRRFAGLLSVSVNDVQSRFPVIRGFQSLAEVEPGNPRPAFVTTFEYNIDRFPTLGATQGLFSTQFGSLIYHYAQSLSSSYFDGQILQKATQDVFTSLFAIMAKQFLVRPTAPQHISGTVERNETRVVVVRPIAYVIITLLLLLIIMLVWICYYSTTHRSILYEEPYGMLGMAAILRNSELTSRLQAIDAGECGGKVMAEFSTTANEDSVNEGWVFQDLERSDKARLCSSRIHH